MTKHSPGPWTIEQNVIDVGDINIAAEYDPAVHGSPILIANIETGYSFDDRVNPPFDRKVACENARLIAAAPDLLAACLEACYKVSSADVLRQLEAAIKKATQG